MTPTSDPSFCGLKRLPQEPLEQVFDRLVPTIPRFAITTQSYSSMMHYASQLDMTFEKWVAAKEANIVTVLADVPYGTRIGKLIVTSKMSESSAPKVRRDTIVIPVGPRFEYETDYTSLGDPACMAGRLHNEAQEDIAPFTSIGRLVLDSRITSDSYERASITDQHQLSQILSVAVAFSNHVRATVCIEASDDDFPTLRGSGREIPRSLEWSGVTLECPSWYVLWDIPDQMRHTYSFNITQALTKDITSTQGQWRSILDRQNPLVRNAVNAGTTPKILFHLYVDPSNQDAVDAFDADSFQDIFNNVVDEKFRHEQMVQLQLGGDSPIPALPYDLEEESNSA